MMKNLKKQKWFMVMIPRLSQLRKHLVDVRDKIMFCFSHCN